MEYFIGISSKELNKEEVETLGSSAVTGVVLFGRNIGGLESTKKLVRQLKTIRPKLKVAVDEEGGFVSRFAHMIPNYSQPYVANLPENKVRDYFQERSEFLKSVGVDINFAPVVDLAPNEKSFVYKRSFGADRDRIVELGLVCIEEQRNAGVSSCLKHFPGHGFTDIDSHEQLPVVKQSKDEWLNNEGHIFKELITKAKPEYVMVGHILYPQVDDKPASLSKKWISGILKTELGYKGSVLSDDISMKALSQSLKERDFEDIGFDVLTSSKGVLS